MEAKFQPDVSRRQRLALSKTWYHQSIRNAQMATVLVYALKTPSYYLGLFSTVSRHHVRPQSDICNATSQHDRHSFSFNLNDVGRAWFYAMAVPQTDVSYLICTSMCLGPLSRTPCSQLS